MKHIRILATGGTIAGTGSGGSVSYRPGVVSVDDLVAALPGVEALARISAEQLANIGSYDIGEELWRKLLGRIEAGLADPDVDGIVITHGTDTIEETAYFLSLLLPAGKPVALVGSMRPAGALSSDGPHNLMDAVRLAGSNDAHGRGVMVVMNDTIFDAASVTKADAHRLGAFAAPSRAPIGHMLGSAPVFHSAPRARLAPFELRGESLPRVAIAYAYAGIGERDIRAVAEGAQGLVIAGVGAGNFSAGARKAVQDLTASGIPVVRTARQGTGDIWREDEQAGERSDDVLGTIAGRELPPAKARLLLMLALQVPRTAGELQALFDRYGATDC
jgi:L-asparaginase